MIKAIPNFDGYYISSEGVVYSSLGKGNRDRNIKRELHEIKARPTREGYLRVYMRDMALNKRVDRYVHRLVAENFLEKQDGKNIVNHIDCNRGNNHISNLEWVTAKENVEHAMTVGSLGRCPITGRLKRK